MKKEELIQFLKENLQVKLESEYGTFGSYDKLHVKIVLAGEEISSDYTTLTGDTLE